MRFFCQLPVRDEGDIIGQSLQALLTWADEIFVFDTGSADDTWDIVQDFAARDKRVIPMRQDPVYFNDTRLRGWIFEHVREHMETGDWFLRVDADEFHHIPPPEFVKTRLRPHETIVYHQYYDFQLTASELRAWKEGRETLADRKRPIAERRHWFTPSVYSEPRLCRYRESMRWTPKTSFPYNAGFVAAERLPIRHYPHRDPVQLERRCLLRAVMLADKENRRNWSEPELHHWVEEQWHKFIAPDNAPGALFWKPGDALPEYHFTNHLAPFYKRQVQRFVHAVCLPLLDSTRPHWPEDAYPRQIESDVQARLLELLRHP
jgi:glycosyltransferase involved in cell wall biosynthesis